MKKNIYLILTVLGTVFAYYFIFRFYADGDGSTIPAVLGLFTTNMSAAFNTDLLFSIFVYWVFVYIESKRINLKNWWLFIIAAFAGLCFALPLFLYFRERHLEKSK